MVYLYKLNKFEKMYLMVLFVQLYYLFRQNILYLNKLHSLFNMDISTLFLGSGFAIFLALLAWGNKIREPRREIYEIEKLFLKKFKTNKKNINPLLKQTYEKMKNNEMENFLDTIGSLVSIMDEIKQPEDVNIIEKFQEINTIRKKLEKLYKTRYILSLFFTFYLLLSGIISLFIGEIYYRDIPIITLNNCLLIIFIIFIYVLLTTMGIIYFKEEKFIKKIDETNDLMDVN